MADHSKPFAMVKGQRMRVTKLDECGNPLMGPNSQIVTSGFISVAFSAQTEDGNTITQTNANGDTCIRDESDPEFLGYTLEIALCGVDPDLIGFFTGNDVVLDDSATPLAVGFTVGTDTDVSLSAFALELWSKVPGEACTAGAKSYGYTLTPFAKGGVLGDFTIQNDAVNFTVSNAKTQDGNGWGVGPYGNVLKTSAGADSPLLVALGAKKHLLVERTTAAPPVPAGQGSQPLGVAATTLVAGVPGHTTPTNSYAPANLAGTTGLTASPTTAWTTGQYVTLRDGSKVHWTGTAWAAGPA